MKERKGERKEGINVENANSLAFQNLYPDMKSLKIQEFGSDIPVLLFPAVCLQHSIFSRFIRKR